MKVEGKTNEWFNSKEEQEQPKLSVTYKGTEEQRVAGVGLFPPGVPVEVPAEKEALILGVGSPLFVIEKLKPLKGDEKKGAVESAASKAVREGDMLASEKASAIESNIKPKKVGGGER